VVDRIQVARMVRRIPWKEQAILFRTNAQSRPLETALRQAAVRYHLIGGQSFFDRREIRDLLAYLKTMVNPHDDISLLRIANVPARGLSDVTMERLLAASSERKASVFSTMKNPSVTTTFQSRSRESIEQFVEFVEHWRSQLRHAVAPGTARPLQAWADNLLQSCGYYADTKRSEKSSEAGENRVRNLKDFVATLDNHATGGTLAERLESFLEDVALNAEREEEEDAGDAVTLITMHSCKGLEFPHVHIVGLEQGLLPHARSTEENTVDEERRLFYVALTRAMQTLTIRHCGGRKKYGQLTPSRPSEFLKDLPEELINRGDETAERIAPSAGKDLFAAMRAQIQ
jgi:DNA helicase II / ATP-dependent DNA helicase PcrA